MVCYKIKTSLKLSTNMLLIISNLKLLWAAQRFLGQT